ncbi:MAG: nucleotidyltransferase [Burkholderiales bacterium]|jgi:predicted nucleotidyltransferase
MNANHLPQFNMLNLAHRIQPMPAQLEKAKIHQHTVRLRLSKVFDVARVVQIGSHARETAIRDFSDLDLLGVLKRDEARWGGGLVSSATVLARFIDELIGRFPNTAIGRDGMAVAVWFSATQQSLDVVPAIFHRFDRHRPVYLIPNGKGDWMETSPEVHDLYFKQADARSQGKLRKVSQLLKWWKFCRASPIPISSFHLDMLLAASGICVGVKSYSQCLYLAFKLLHERGCRGLHDPCGVAGTIYAASTESKWGQLVSAVAYSLDHAQAALAAEAVGDKFEANRQWNIVFNGGF